MVAKTNENEFSGDSSKISVILYFLTPMKLSETFELEPKNVTDILVRGDRNIYQILHGKDDVKYHFQILLDLSYYLSIVIFT